MFERAQKKDTHLKIAITGASGSGKTYGALRLAKGIRGKIALIDTENSSASLYSDKFEFDSCNIEPPYTVRKYLDAIQFAIKAGYEVLVIDSLSHVWASEGGLLDKKSNLDAQGRGNSYTNWQTISKEYEQLRSLILHAPIHMICTMRSKQEYVMDDQVISAEGKTKKTVKKVGMAPVMREGMEYEFTVVFDVSHEHIASAGKDRTDLFDGQFFKLEEKIGEKLTNWLGVTKPVAETGKASSAGPDAQRSSGTPDQTKKEVKSDSDTALSKVSNDESIGKNTFHGPNGAADLGAEVEKNNSSGESPFRIPKEVQDRIQEQEKNSAPQEGLVKILCPLCSTAYKRHTAKPIYFCPNWTDKTRGEHPVLSAAQYAERWEQIRSAAALAKESMGGLQ